MNRLFLQRVIFFLGVFLTTSAWAEGRIRNISANMEEGNRVELIIAGDHSDNLNCDLQVRFGDGKRQTFQMRANGQRFPLVISRTYLSGTYSAQVEGRRGKRTPGCRGSATTTFAVP